MGQADNGSLERSPTERTHWLFEQLVALYGEPEWRPNGDPVGELVLTILSQHTSDINSERAYQRLRATFPRWADVRDAEPAAIEEAIRVGGLARVKAPRIQQVLRETQERMGGAITLEPLREMSLDDARNTLLTLSGVGPKTASCVLLFALGMPAFPVDMHVMRVTSRFGLVGPKVSASAACLALEAIIPPGRRYAFHINLIRHGRAICHAQRPACERCGVRRECDYFRVRVAAEAATPG